MKVTIIITPVSSLPSLNISPNTQVVKVTVYDGRFNQSPGGGIPEAPNDSNAYLRSGLTWVIGYTKTFLDNTFAAISQAIDNLSNNLSNHVSDTNNPHDVTASQVGAYTTSEVDTALNTKVDKVTGLQLSQESYTTVEKNKLASLIPSVYKRHYIDKNTHAITGVTGDHVYTTASILIPANTVVTGDVFYIKYAIYKSGTGTCQPRLAIGSSNIVPNGTSTIQLGQIATTDTANRIHILERNSIKAISTGLIAPSATSNFFTDIVAAQGVNTSSLNVDWSVDNYIIPYVTGVSATTVVASLIFFEVKIY